MKKVGVVLLASALLWTACSEQEQVTSSSSNPSATTIRMSSTGEEIDVCKSEECPLTAGQDIAAGTISYANDGTNLYITVTSTEGFQDQDENLKIWVGTNLELLPLASNGNPIAGQFPFKYEVEGNTFTATISFEDIERYSGAVSCESMFYIFVHADVIAGGTGETAWGGCLEGTNSPRWYFYSTYQATCCVPPPPMGRTETAFAKGNVNAKNSDHWVFTMDPKSNPDKLSTLALTRNRWGWALNIKSTGSYVYKIYAAAGLNDIRKGVHVGNLSVEWTGSEATFTYATLPGFELNGVHIYSGDNRPATIAPGRYGFIGASVNGSTFTTTLPVSDSDGDGIWIIAHAGVSF